MLDEQVVGVGVNHRRGHIRPTGVALQLSQEGAEFVQRAVPGPGKACRVDILNRRRLEEVGFTYYGIGV